MSNILELRINTSGKSIPIYDTDTQKTVGTLGQREAFILYGGDGSLKWIKFRGSNLKLVDALVQDPDDVLWRCKPIQEMPYGTATINGTKYKTYIMRKTMNVYTAAGTYWGRVAAGMLVATNSSTVGLNHPTWKAVDYVKSTAGKWVKVDGDGYDHGFVDYDLGNGSMPSNIALYGSW